jgi:hypothetical protein
LCINPLPPEQAVFLQEIERDVSGSRKAGVWEGDEQMKRKLTAQVGADGILTLSVPLGREGASKTVRVIVETVEEAADRPAMSREEWVRFVQSMAGRISDPTFERHPQGEYEERNPLP